MKDENSATVPEGVAVPVPSNRLPPPTATHPGTASSHPGPAPAHSGAATTAPGLTADPVAVSPPRSPRRRGVERSGSAQSNGAQPPTTDSAQPPTTDQHKRHRQGTALAFLGVLAFSGSFPATVHAMQGFDPWLVAIGRAAIAGAIAVACLKATNRPLLPPKSQWPAYALISLGVVFGFPVFSGLALDLGASTAHAAVITGLLPAATAACAVLRASERPRPLFWAACTAGAIAITTFTLIQHQGRPSWPDLLLIGALLSAAVGYTEGARLSRHTPGWQVISHTLVLSLPLTAPITAVLALTTPITLTPQAVTGFAYVSAVSMFIGFIPWYAGLARGGIARAGQTQLTQPLLTLIWAWFLMGERFGPATVAAALAVLVCVAITQRART